VGSMEWGLRNVSALCCELNIVCHCAIFATVSHTLFCFLVLFSYTTCALVQVASMQNQHFLNAHGSDYFDATELDVNQCRALLVILVLRFDCYC
jgi:hypothetical protein